MTTTLRRIWVSLVMLGSLSAGAHAVTVPGDFPTIQAALDEVIFGALPSGTVIDVQAGTYFEALRFGGSPKALTLRGVSGAAATVINSSGTGMPALSLFNATGAVAVQGLTFTGASTSAVAGGGVAVDNATVTFTSVVVQGNATTNDGGGLNLSRANVTIDSSTVQNNSAGRHGGGLVATAGSTVSILGSMIQNNTSGTMNDFGAGGGIHANDSSVDLRSSSVTGNQALFAGGGVFALGPFGSANGIDSLVVEDSDVSDNTVSRANAASPPAEGGGIHIEDDLQATITRSTIENNNSNSGGGFNSFRAAATMVDSVIEGNTAQDPQSVGGFAGGVHGISSLDNAKGSTINLQRTAVRGNTADRVGGILVAGIACGGGGSCGQLDLTDSLVDGNTAPLDAGGIRLTDGTLTMQNSQVLRNQVTATAGGGFGGGLTLAFATATISGSTIAANLAGEFGGGIFVDQSTTINVSGSNIYDNATTNSNGGGGIAVGSNGPTSGAVQDSQIADNSDFQIRENVCPPVAAPILSYLNNRITNQGASKVYMSPCLPPGNITNIADFNNLSPGVKTVGNTALDPDFTSFSATPPQAETALTWSVARASTVNIVNLVPSGQPGPTESAIVNPECTTVYTLNGVDATVIGTGSLEAPPSCGGTPLNIFNENIGGMQTREAPAMVTAEQVEILDGADATFRSGQSIEFRDGFVVGNADFRAEIDYCLCE